MDRNSRDNTVHGRVLDGLLAGERPSVLWQQPAPRALWKACLQHSPEEAGANHPHRCSLRLLEVWSPSEKRCSCGQSRRSGCLPKVTTAGFHSSKTIGAAAPRAATPSHRARSHLGWEVSTQAGAESRGQPQTWAPSCRRQWFLSYLVCCHSPAAGGLLGRQCCSLRALGGKTRQL